MDAHKTVEIMRTALELLVDRGRFSTTEVINGTDCTVSNSETESVLLILEDIGWIKKSNKEPSTWVQGPSGNEYLDSTSIDNHALRVLPDEVPDDERLR